MDEQKYTIIKQYLGIELLKYSLNYEREINWHSKLSELNLNNDQLEALKILDQQIKIARLSHIHQNGFGDEVDSYIDPCIFDQCRNQCDGSFLKFENSEDKLLSFLIRLAIQLYPFLLMRTRNSPFLPIQNRRDLSQEFCALIRSDALNNLTNKSEYYSYSFQLNASYGLQFSLQVSVACECLIQKSFENCCNKLKYLLKDLIEEITLNVNNLRLLAKGQQAQFSTFVGIKGIVLEDLNEIDFDNCILRKVPNEHNLNGFINLVTLAHTDNMSQFSSGGIIEIPNYITASLSDKPITCSSTKESVDYVNSYIENIKLSLCFSLKEKYAFTKIFVINGFPLVNAGSYSWDYIIYPRNYPKINNENVSEIKEWNKKLSNIDKRKIRVPLKRLNRAIHERAYPEDSIIDALIALEGMFSGSPETTFKVCGSIAKFIKAPNERELFFIKLKNFYNLRSKISHGNDSEKPDLELMKLSLELIEIGLDCLKKLISEPDLLKLSPVKRVEKILLFT